MLRRAKQNIEACPTVGCVRHFSDPLTVRCVPFYGPAITPANNSNWGQADNSATNTTMQKGVLATDPTARAQAWASIDKASPKQLARSLGDSLDAVDLIQAARGTFLSVGDRIDLSTAAGRRSQLLLLGVLDW